MSEPEPTCPVPKILKGAVLGGLVLWFWGTFFWAFSGIPVAQTRAFRDPAAVEQVLRENAPEPGYYALPAPQIPEGTPDPDSWIQARMEKISTGFFMAGAVRPGGLGPMGAQVGQTVLGCALAAGLMTCLLLGAGHASFRRRYAMVLGAAVLCWVVATYPEVIWWGDPAAFAACKLLDFLVGWGLAGIPLAWITGECPAS